MRRMLLLDDEPHVLSALKRLLYARLHDVVRVEAATDPHAALARLREAAFDLVISDYRMPTMNGIEFLKHVRTLQPHAVRMMLSASSDFETLLHAVNQVEVFRYLAKPWVPDDLIAQVRAALERAERAREERRLADAMRVQTGQTSAAQAERRRLEELEPGITHVDWGPNGEVLMPELAIEGDPFARRKRR